MKIDKVKILTAKLTKAAISGLILIVVISGVAYFVDAEVQNIDKENKKLNREISSIKREKNNYSKKLGLANEYISQYEKIKTEFENERLSLNRKIVRNKLNALKEKHKIADLQVNISPAKAIAEKELKKKNIDVQTSPINISLKAFTDIDVYNFIHDLSKEMPGFVVVKTFNIYRNSDLGKNNLIAISRGSKPTIVTSDIALDWVGIKND